MPLLTLMLSLACWSCSLEIWLEARLVFFVLPSSSGMFPEVKKGVIVFIDDDDDPKLPDYHYEHTRMSKEQVAGQMARHHERWARGDTIIARARHLAASETPETRKRRRLAIRSAMGADAR